MADELAAQAAALESQGQRKDAFFAYRAAAKLALAEPESPAREALLEHVMAQAEALSTAITADRKRKKAGGGGGGGGDGAAAAARPRKAKKRGRPTEDRLTVRIGADGAADAAAGLLVDQGMAVLRRPAAGSGCLSTERLAAMKAAAAAVEAMVLQACRARMSDPDRQGYVERMLRSCCCYCSCSSCCSAPRYHE